MSAHDAYLAEHSRHPVRAICLDCDEEWDDELESEYGSSWLSHNEQCPKCGADGDHIRVDDLDDIDIQERILEARGIDF